MKERLLLMFKIIDVFVKVEVDPLVGKVFDATRVDKI